MEILEEQTIGEQGRRVLWDGKNLKFYMGQEYRFSLNPAEQVALVQFIEYLAEKYMQKT